jgi:hypothetical protein
MKGLIEEGASEEEALDYEYPEPYLTDRPEWQKRSWGRRYQHWKSYPHNSM